MSADAGERWQRLSLLFESVRELAPDDRRAALARACRDDTGLIAEVQDLVDAWHASPAFLEEPAFALLDVAQPQDEAAIDDMIGVEVGSYRISRRLGAGGMGRVYQASRADGQFEREVAIKVMRSRVASGTAAATAAAEHLAHERRLLGRLQHPSIVALLDAGVLEDGQPYLVMELVRGTPIDQHVRANALPLAARLALMLRVCEAVTHAHRHLIVHGDLKPENVLVTEDGFVKLLDFGIAQLVRAGLALAAPAPLSPACASPEQMRGEPLTTQSDVFSLGVLLGRLLDGSDVPRDLELIAQKASRSDPAHRYESVEQLASDVRRFLAREPVLARGGGLGYRAARMVSRHRLASAALAVALLSLIGGTVAATLSLARARASESLAWQHHLQAVRVADFLQDLLLALVPGTTPDDGSLARVLRDAAPRALDQLAGLDEALGRVHFAIGHLHAASGDAAAALPHLEAALTIAERSRGFSKRDLARYRERFAEVRDGPAGRGGER